MPGWQFTVYVFLARRRKSGGFGFEEGVQANCWAGSILPTDDSSTTATREE